MPCAPNKALHLTEGLFLRLRPMARQSDSAPEFVKFVGPVFDALTALGGSGRPEEVRSAIAKAMNVSEEQQAQPLPS